MSGSDQTPWILPAWNGAYMFEDPILRMEEEKDYLEKNCEGKRSRKSFMADSENFGRICLLSDLDENPERIYRLISRGN